MAARSDTQPISINVAGGWIASDGDASEEVIDVSGFVVFPGFIDVHNHGAVGVDVNAADVDGLMEVAAFLATKGVTGWLPTLVPDSDENYRRAIKAIDTLMEFQTDRPIAQALGVHYEGVFANESMCGALRPEYFRRGSWSVAGGRLPRLANGVHMTTLAPEVDSGIELIEALVADGWVVSIGHTRADAATLDRAFAAGARHMTHFFNAMTGIHHRDIGVAGWGLAKRDVTFDIIADGVHVDTGMLGVACRSKTPQKVSLISDSVAPTGLGDGQFDLWGETIAVRDGRTRNERGSIAGSVCTMYDCVQTMLSIGFSTADVNRMASTNPARLLGLTDRGSIEVGRRADLVGLDGDGNIAFTMIGGRMVEN
ncbi:MAG: N-acetylglucosamine-6-phosphate deacetylase [Pyrinomonadaceae bacterium]